MIEQIKLTDIITLLTAIISLISGVVALVTKLKNKTTDGKFAQQVNSVSGDNIILGKGKQVITNEKNESNYYIQQNYSNTYVNNKSNEAESDVILFFFFMFIALIFAVMVSIEIYKYIWIAECLSILTTIILFTYQSITKTITYEKKSKTFFALLYPFIAISLYTMINNSSEIAPIINQIIDYKEANEIITYIFNSKNAFGIILFCVNNISVVSSLLFSSLINIANVLKNTSIRVGEKYVDLICKLWFLPLIILSVPLMFYLLVWIQKLF